MVKGARQTIEETVTTWEGVSAHTHHFGGREFKLGGREIGHSHGDRLIDIPFPVKVRDALVKAGEVEPHHILPASGWVSFYLREEDDVLRATSLLKTSYELALKQQARRRTNKP